MTTGFIKEKMCYCCRTPNRYPEIGAMVSYIGTRDLDTRFSETQRASVYTWVQQCLSCGYCNVDIASGTEEAKKIVGSEAYKKRLTNPWSPDTANAFLCEAMILEMTGKLAAAGWASLRAAWICDDSGSRDAAADARQLSFSLFSRARSAGESLDSAVAEGVLLVDLLRRSKQFEKAASLVALESESAADERSRLMFEFELELIESKDSKCHTVTEALQDSGL